MALQGAVEAPKSGQQLRIEKATVGKHRVEHCACVSLAEKQPIPVRPNRIFRINAEMVKIQGGQDFGDRKSTPDMSSHVCPHHAQHFDSIMNGADGEISNQSSL